MCKAAVNYLKPATAKAPNPKRRFHLGLAYLKSGERELGREMIAQALEDRPSLGGTEHGAVTFYGWRLSHGPGSMRHC
jgi:hypothetical protein